MHTGWAVSAFFGYLKGVNNELALKHVPEVLPRSDSLAGPVGRRGDQVQHACLTCILSYGWHPVYCTDGLNRIASHCQNNMLPEQLATAAISTTSNAQKGSAGLPCAVRPV